VRLSARLEGGRTGLKSFDLKSGEGLPTAAPRSGEAVDPELREAILAGREGSWVLTLVFVPWSPGKGSLPPLNLPGLRVPALDYETASVLAPGDRELEGPRPQRDPPGTILYIYGLLALLALLALAAAALVFWLIPGARALLAGWREKEAWKTLSATLDWLDDNAGGAEAAPFFALLAAAERRYLARRLVAEAEALTPAELRALPLERFPDADSREELAALLAEADRVRFGGERPGPGPRLAASGRLRALGALAEEHLDARA